MSHVSSLPPPPPPAPFGGSPPPFVLHPNPFASAYQVRPSARWYFIVIVIGFAISVIGPVVIVTSAIKFVDKIDDFQRVDVPGTGTVLLEAGSYTVYAEGSGTGRVTIRQPNEQLVELRPYSGEISYDVSNHDGRALFSFRAGVTGRYFIATTGPAGAVIAIGPGLGSGLVAGILAGIGLILAGIAFAVVGSIVVGAKRRRSRRAQFTSPPPRS